jgi:hypothetical protein
MSERHPVLPIAALDRRHPGLTPAIAAGYSEAAAVCLSRHHEPPSDFQIEDNQEALTITILWDAPSPQTRLAWANTTDATEAGACACALAAIEQSRGLYAIQRAETLTGADYYMAPMSDQGIDLENCYRVEISGTDLATLEVRRRLKVKLQQLRSGQSDLPAIAIVIGFKASLILIQTLET